MVKSGGINRILFFIDGNLTNEDEEVFGILKMALGPYDDKLLKIVSIIRTNFPSFKDEKRIVEDIQRLAAESNVLVNRIGVENIIHVDNPPQEGSEGNNANRQDSRKILVGHLAKFKSDVYKLTHVDDVKEKVEKWLEERKRERDIEKKTTKLNY